MLTLLLEVSSHGVLGLGRKFAIPGNLIHVGFSKQVLIRKLQVGRKAKADRRQAKLGGLTGQVAQDLSSLGTTLIAPEWQRHETGRTLQDIPSPSLIHPSRQTVQQGLLHALDHLHRHLAGCHRGGEFETGIHFIGSRRYQCLQ